MDEIQPIILPPQLPEAVPVEVNWGTVVASVIVSFIAAGFGSAIGALMLSLMTDGWRFSTFMICGALFFALLRWNFLRQARTDRKTWEFLIGHKDQLQSFTELPELEHRHEREAGESYAGMHRAVRGGGVGVVLFECLSRV